MSPTVPAACVIGWPVGHSRSPLIHKDWLKQDDLEARLRREAIAPETFADFSRISSERGYVGANITIPHKEAALAMSEPDDARVRSALPTRSGMTAGTFVRPTPTSRASLPISTLRCRAGTSTPATPSCSAPAVRRVPSSMA